MWAALAPIVVDDVVRYIIAVAPLAVVAPASIDRSKRLDDAVHELPRTAMTLAGVLERLGMGGRDLINDNYFGRSWEAEIGRFVDGARGV